MRVLLFVVVATSVLGWGHPLERISPAQGRQVNRFLKGKYERQWKRQGGNYGEIVGGGAGNAVGQLASAALGTLTGGNIGTRAGRSGLGAAARISGEYLGAIMAARRAQATAANAKKAEAEALKKPVLYSGGDYQKAKLSRTGSSPALLQRNKGAPGGASTSGNKPQVNNKGKAPMNAGGSSGASTSGTKGSPSKALASTKHGASTSGTKSAPSSPSRPTSGQGDKKPGAFSRAKESVKTTLRNAVTPSANKMLRLNAIAPQPPPAGKSGGGQAVVKSKKK
ncbi:unnamed protein product [Aphanomyces euteiches]